MNKLLSVLSILLLSQCLPVPKAQAQTDNAHTVTHSPSGSSGRPHAGIVLGIADRVGEMGAGFNYGVDGGIELSSPWSLGLQINTFKSSTDIIGASLSIQRWSILPKITYNFGGTTPIIRDSYAGLKFGAVIDRFEAITAAGSSSDNMTRLGIAPVVGFDEPIADQWSAGLELSYLLVFGPEDNNDSMSALGALKYWF